MHERQAKGENQKHVTRPIKTETQGLKLPIIYVTSPYFAGVAPETDGAFWNVKHEIG